MPVRASLPLWHNWVPTSGCLVSQPPRLLTVPEPHQGTGKREIQPCLYVFSACQGSLWGAQGQGTVAHRCYSPAGCGPPVGLWGGLCVPQQWSRGALRYTKAAGGFFGSGDLRLPPAHGGTHGACDLGCFLNDPEGQRWRCTECQTRWGRLCG